MRMRLSNRVMDLRNPVNHALFKIRAMVLRQFREVLDNKGFVEIQSPKLQPAATESGAEVFKVNYFGRTAFLAQSPQFAKQMMISADFGRVYEVGSAYEPTALVRKFCRVFGLTVSPSDWSGVPSRKLQHTPASHRVHRPRCGDGHF
jgi:hypothetical protein